MKFESKSKNGFGTKQSLWNKYKATVNRNCSTAFDELDALPYWRNKLFAAIMIYLLPLSFVAVIPGIIMSIVGGAIPLAIFDALVGFFVAFISLAPKLSVATRKTLFIIVLYATATILLYYLGSFGPGLLYLVVITIFVILIFPKRIALLSVIINTIVCFLFGVAIYFKLINSPIIPQYSVGSWIAVSSNAIFLSAVMAILIPTLFDGLQNFISEQIRLKSELDKKHQALEQTLQTVEYKNNELEQFAYIASHDLQEPLRSITGLISMLQKRYENNQDDMEIIKHISTSSDRMRSLITGLLEYARIGIEKKISVVDCNVMISELMQDLALLIQENHVKFSVARLPVIEAYPIELKQLFQNLIVNAIKFRRKDVVPEIEIGVSENIANWLFYVKDNGIGIEEKYQSKIFVIFKRLHKRSEYEGTGIGLAYCQKIVELHGGKISVESEEGKGATFHFSIRKTL